LQLNYWCAFSSFASKYEDASEKQLVSAACDANGLYLHCQQEKRSIFLYGPRSAVYQQFDLRLSLKSNGLK
jgi:hypothetical protein